MLSGVPIVNLQVCFCFRSQLGLLRFHVKETQLVTENIRGSYSSNYVSGLSEVESESSPLLNESVMTDGARHHDLDSVDQVALGSLETDAVSCVNNLVNSEEEIAEGLAYAATSISSANGGLEQSAAELARTISAVVDESDGETEQAPPRQTTSLSEELVPMNSHPSWEKSRLERLGQPLDPAELKMVYDAMEEEFARERVAILRAVPEPLVERISPVREKRGRSRTRPAAQPEAPAAALTSSSPASTAARRQAKRSVTSRKSPSHLRLSKEEFAQLTDAQRGAWKTVKGTARQAMYDDLKGYIANLQGKSDAAKESSEDREEDKPKPRNVDPDPFETDRDILPHNGRYYELAYPDELVSYQYPLLCTAIVYFVALSCFRWLGIVHLMIALSHLACVAVCNLRFDDEYMPITVGGVDHGAYRSLRRRTQWAHLVLLVSSGAGIVLCMLELFALFMYIAYIWAMDVWSASLLLAVPAYVITLGFMVTMVVMMIKQLRNEIISVTRMTLHVDPPQDPGQLRGVRLNDPANPTFVVDNRPQNMQGSDLTVPVLSRGTAQFRVRVAHFDDVAMNCIGLHSFLARCCGIYATDVRLQYSMALLQEYSTLGNTCVGLTHPLRLQKMLLYKNNFHKVLYPRTENMRIQNTANNSAVIAAFISETQNAILRSAALNWVCPTVPQQ